jgi:tetratricopeptide (TPR) repeat protein
MALGMATPTRRPWQLINFFLPLPLIVLSLFLSGCRERVPDFTPEELVEAEMQVREAFRLQDYEYGAELGQRWSRWVPDAVELKAWTVANLAKAGRDFPAEEMARTLAAEHPDSPWSSFATAAAVTWAQDEAHGEEAVEASERTMTGLPDLIEAVLLRGDALYQFRGPEEAMAFAENLSAELKAHPEVRATLASAMWPASGEASDPIVDEMLTILDGVLLEDPDHLTANLEEAVVLFVLRRDPEEAFSHFERAAAVTPSPLVHAQYWSSLFRDSGLEETERYARVAADVRKILEDRGESPARWAGLAGRLRRSGLRELAEEVEALVLEEPPRDPAVETVLANRFQELAREIWAAEVPAEERNAEVRAQLKTMLQDFVARREHHDPGLLLEARWDLFLLHHEDSETDSETLRRVAEEVLEQMEIWPGHQASAYFGTLARTLAERIGAPEEARRAMDLWEVNLRDHGGLLVDQAEGGKEPSPRVQAEESLFYTALASVLLQEGALDEAEAELARSGELDPENWYADMALPLSHLYSGRVMEARASTAATEGERERYLRSADEFYLEGIRAAYWADPTLGRPWTNPNELALAALYEMRHGGREGFEEYLLAASAEDLEERKAEILAGRIQNPEPMAPFVLETLDGEEVRSESLLGRVLVINFWGTW